MHPVVALVTAGVEMDVLGLTYREYSDVEREAVVKAHPRTGSRVGDAAGFLAPAGRTVSAVVAGEGEEPGHDKPEAAQGPNGHECCSQQGGAPSPWPQETAAFMGLVLRRGPGGSASASRERSSVIFLHHWLASGRRQADAVVVAVPHRGAGRPRIFIPFIP
jgi:hypothetical protein